MQPIGAGAGLVSGEGVALSLTTAGVGSRTVAAAIDASIQLVALFALVLLTVFLAGGADSAATTALTLVELLLVLAGYPIVMEWTTRGRTLGKLWMGLRVVRDDGGPIGFRQALVRGLAGLILEKPGLLFPFTTIAGVLTISLSDQEKRIGDMMAGTIVLNERSAPQGLAPPPVWVPPPLQPWAMALDLQRLDDRLALRVRQFVTRAHAMSPAAQWSLGESLRTEVLAAVSPEPPWGAPTSAVLAAVLAERRRRAAWATQPTHQPAPTYQSAPQYQPAPTYRPAPQYQSAPNHQPAPTEPPAFTPPS